MGTRFNDLSAPSDVIYLVGLWRRHYPPSPRHLAEAFLDQGFVFSHEKEDVTVAEELRSHTLRYGTVATARRRDAT